MSVTSMQDARRSRGRRTAAAADVDLAAFVTSWQLALEAAGKSPRTVRSYTDSVRALQKFLVAQGMPADVEEVDAEHLRAFLLAEERRTSATSAAVHFRNLRVFFGWLAREGERTNPNPMDRVDRPKVTKQAKPFFEDEELAALLKTCEGANFQDRRDTAIMRILIDTGMRVSGLANLRYDPDKDAAQRRVLDPAEAAHSAQGRGRDMGADREEGCFSAGPVPARPRSPSGGIVPVAVARPPRAQSRPHDRLRDSRHARPTRQAGRNPERPPAPLPPLLRGQVARGRRLYG